jgi:hypothetical protein
MTERKSADVIDFDVERIRRQPAPPPDVTYRLTLHAGEVNVTVDVSRDQLLEFAQRVADALAEDADDDGEPPTHAA